MQDIINCGKWTSNEIFPFLETSGHILYLRDLLRLILNLCTYVGPILIVLYLLRQNKNKNKSRLLAFLIFSIGLGNGIAQYIFSSNRIGAFYERDSYYSEKYEAYIYNSAFQNDNYVFCIATISHDRGVTLTWENGPHCFLYDNYFLEKLELPYNRTRDETFTFYPDGKYGIAIEHMYPSFALEITDIASESSYDILNNEILSTDGKIIASINGDVYHHENCQHIKQIKPQNCVRFNSEIEAQFYGYDACLHCIDE